MSGWLLLVPFQASSSALMMVMATDECGQILAPEKLLEIGMLMKILHGALVVALIIELVIPKASWSAWVLVSLPTAGFLLVTSAIAILNADFLTRCDIFILSPTTTAQLNILTVAALGFLGVKRLRQEGMASI
ncbi:hypothetical protein [Paracoccus alkanivorans]|nr:hypothetical protein [Paracoccus alkanivorans]